jgi:PAS domain S-box-containing protein
MFRKKFKTEAARYGSVLALVFAAIVCRWALEPILDGAGFSIFLATVLICAWVGGLGPSILAQTLLLFAHGILFATIGPQSSQAGGWRGLLGICAYYLVGTVVALLSEARQSSLKRVTLQKERIALQDQELKAIISGIGDGVIVTDQSGNVSFLNPTAEIMTGWRVNEALGNPLALVFQIRDEAGASASNSPVERVLTQGATLHEGRIVALSTRGAGQVPITYKATPIFTPSGIISGTVVIVRDESERRRAEEWLHDMNRRKDDFLATLAHELRNPLAPIRNGLQLLKMSKGDPKIASEVQGIMERQVQHIIRLVDDLLDVSRISRGKLQLRRSPTCLATVASSAVQTMQPLINIAQHQLVLCIPAALAKIDADPDRLTQITCNLLHNAIKFTPSGGRIELRVEEAEGETRLIVDDNGCGIPPDNINSIFEMFNQGADEKERGKSGLGVGLTLARRLAEMHGGTLEAYSAGVDKGSTFRLRLPVHVRLSTPAVQQAEPRQPAPQISRRVLLVDDNEDALRTINMMMQSLGNQTCIARNGLEALEAAETFRPEVVLMDLGMPKMNGYEAAKRLRAQPWGKNIVLVALTGWGQEKDRQRTLEAGFDDHLVKPVELEALQNCLGKNHPSFDGSRGSANLNN